jgi:hypothetical protein
MQHQNWLLKRLSTGEKVLETNKKIKLTTTSGFYSTEIPKLSGATVSISANIVFNFVEIPNQANMFVQILSQRSTEIHTHGYQ